MAIDYNAIYYIINYNDIKNNWLNIMNYTVCIMTWIVTAKQIIVFDNVKYNQNK